MSVQWMSGKSSLHFDTIMYYWILHKEFAIVAKIQDKQCAFWFIHCQPLAEKAYGK